MNVHSKLIEKATGAGGIAKAIKLSEIVDDMEVFVMSVHVNPGGGFGATKTNKITIEDGYGNTVILAMECFNWNL